MSPPPEQKRPLAVRAATGAVMTNGNIGRVGNRWPSRQHSTGPAQFAQGLEICGGEPVPISVILKRIAVIIVHHSGKNPATN